MESRKCDWEECILWDECRIKDTCNYCSLYRESKIKIDAVDLLKQSIRDSLKKNAEK